MKNISYTFIIPHHNSPKLLNRCLNSIPEREDIQIIVVDDNSRQDAKPCIKRSDVEVIYIDAANTKGAGRARNVGLKSAKGKWVLFADCDDYYSLGFLDVLDKYKEQEIDVLYFNYNYIDGASGHVIKDNKLQQVLCQDQLSSDDVGYIKYMNNEPWNKMVKYGYIEKHKMYFEEVPHGNDILYSLLIASCTDNISTCKERLYNYISIPNSITTKKPTIHICLCRMEHYIKKCTFLESVGYSKWKPNLFIHLCRILKKSGIKQFLQLLFNLPMMFCNRQMKMEWVQLIEKLKKM